MIPICLSKLCYKYVDFFQIFHKQLRTHPNGNTIFLFFNIIIMGHFALAFAHPIQVKFSMYERRDQMQTFEKT